MELIGAICILAGLGLMAVTFVLAILQQWRKQSWKRSMLLHGLGWLVLIVGITLLPIPESSERVTATDAGSPALAPATLMWQSIASWSGSGIKTTESFTTTQPEWRIQWSTKNEVMAGASIIQIYVHNAANAQMVTLAANKQGPGSDVSYVRGTPGRYYLVISSGNIDWTVTAEEQR